MITYVYDKFLNPKRCRVKSVARSIIKVLIELFRRILFCPIFPRSEIVVIRLSQLLENCLPQFVHTWYRLDVSIYLILYTYVYTYLVVGERSAVINSYLQFYLTLFDSIITFRATPWHARHIVVGLKYVTLIPMCTFTQLFKFVAWLTTRGLIF